MSRVFVMGDIHGAHRAMLQCFARARFNYDHDHLICLGDVCDGWPDTQLCIDELLKVRHLTYIKGNHDELALSWMKTGLPQQHWLKHGGHATMQAYSTGIPRAHMYFLEDAPLYYLQDNKLFVHAGIDPSLPLHEHTPAILLYDRTLAQRALQHTEPVPKITSYDEVYLGHTPMQGGIPFHAYEVWLMDTGAGWSGPLTMMDIQSKQLYASDPVPQLYPGVKGRG